MRIITILTFILFTHVCQGQGTIVYNINKYNGLPSNHVYCLLKDKLGYLWIGTTQGILKYNGYTFTKYGYEEGLPNIDIWGIYEDKSGKIWPLSIAPDIGYITKNQYKRVNIVPKDWHTDLYPKSVAEIDEAIIFHTLSPTGSKNTFAVIKNDTLTFNSLVFNDSVRTTSISYLFCNSSIYYVFDSSDCYQYSLKDFLKNPNATEPPQAIAKYDVEFSKILQEEEIAVEFANKYIVCRETGGHTLRFYNLTADTFKIINLDNYSSGNITIGYAYKSHYYCLTNNRIFIIDSNVNIVQNLSIDTLYKDKSLTGSTNTFFLQDKFWGNVLAEKNKGLYVKFNEEKTFIKLDNELADFNYMGAFNDSSGYWWNNNNHILAVFSNARIVSRVHLPEIFDLRKMVFYDEHRSLLLAATTAWLYNGQTVLPFRHEVSKNVVPRKDNSGYYYVNDLLVESKHTLHLLGNSYVGAYTIVLDDKKSSTALRNIDQSRYKGITQNIKNNILICYTYNKVLVLNTTTNKKTIYFSKELERLGINGIEKIFVDDYGNIFIKDYNQLLVFNIAGNSIKRLFRDKRMEGAIIELKNNMLYIAGGFGALKCNISGPQSIKNIRVFPNTKSLLYNHVIDAQFSTSTITLKTDKGIYVVTPGEHDSFNVKNVEQYSFIINYNNQQSKLNDHDTFTILPNTSIEADVIRPTGTGDLNIRYNINGVAYSSIELRGFLNKVMPGAFQKIGIIASDNNWESKPVSFTIYIKPEWWQTPFAKNAILAFSLLLFGSIIYIVVLITRRIVTNNNKRKNQKRELELKSIYSQINPHFIFNSLSTAQYFVKKNQNKEAFEHINQFSDLLRSYIKSSRDKYITIKEELDNLENYLQLQLTRFEDKFDYRFDIDEAINPTTIKIPSLLLQPLVENALNHGIFHSREKGMLLISFQLDDKSGELIILVDDNGIGRQHSKKLSSEFKRKADSYGNILIKELIDTFNKYEKIKIDLKYVDKAAPESGTTVIISIINYTYAK